VDLGPSSPGRRSPARSAVWWRNRYYVWRCKMCTFVDHITVAATALLITPASEVAARCRVLAEVVVAAKRYDEEAEPEPSEEEAVATPWDGEDPRRVSWSSTWPPPTPLPYHPHIIPRTSRPAGRR